MHVLVMFYIGFRVSNNSYAFNGNIMPTQEIIQDSLKQIFSGIRQLKKALPSKEFTIDGRLVGDIGEAIVQRDYDLTLYEGLAKDYDGETSCGKKVQIKATFKDSLTFKKNL